MLGEVSQIRDFFFWLARSGVEVAAGMSCRRYQEIQALGIRKTGIAGRKDEGPVVLWLRGLRVSRCRCRLELVVFRRGTIWADVQALLLLLACLLARSIAVGLAAHWSLDEGRPACNSLARSAPPRDFCLVKLLLGAGAGGSSED